MGFLPPARTPEELRLVPRSDPRLRAAAGAWCRRHGLDDGDVTLFEAGSVPVFAVGAAHVLKLFPPCFGHEADQERAVLDHVAGALPVATPRVLASGEEDGWRYLVMDRLPGVPLDRVWPTLSALDRLALAKQAGRLLAELHALDARGAAIPSPDWPEFVRAQADACVERQRARGAPAWCLAQIPAFLRDAALGTGSPPVLLHTEVMAQHLLAARGPSGWVLTGLVDFEPAMVGAAEYEFAAVGLFLTRGDAPALGELLRAYGLGSTDLGPALQRRFLAYALLHRYSNLRWYLDLRPPPPGTDTLEGIAAWWWALT